jgi:hypothetical protein
VNEVEKGDEGGIGKERGGSGVRSKRCAVKRRRQESGEGGTEEGRFVEKDRTEVSRRGAEKVDSEQRAEPQRRGSCRQERERGAVRRGKVEDGRGSK